MKQLKYLSQNEYDQQRSTYINYQLPLGCKIISLGWDCFSRTLPTWYGIKPTKDQGKLSYPFDLAMHTLPNIIKILQNRFVDYLDDVSYDETLKLWKNNKYGFKYNHDEGLNLEEFKSRYTKRIQNFYQTICTSRNIFFIYHALGNDQPEDILRLNDVLQQICEETHYCLIVISHKWKKLPPCSNVSLCYQPLPWKNYSWWQQDHLTPQGIKFEHAIIDKLVKIMRKYLLQQSNCEQKIKRQRLWIHALTGLMPLKKWRQAFRARHMPEPATVHAYDLIIPLGENCACATLLKRVGLRKFSLPFDWSGLEDVATDFSGGLFTKCNLIFNHCQDILRLEDLIEFPEKRKNPKFKYIVNMHTGLRYIHDFPLDSDINVTYPQIYEKYQRRINRMYEQINKAKSILLLFNRVNYRKADTLEYHMQVVTLLRKFRELYPKKKINFLVFLHKEDFSLSKCVENTFFEDITYVYLNNTWPDKETFAQNEWLGNRDVVLKYLKKHIVLTDRE